ncbi:MAG: phosphotransferase, partial [archaeon]|nr:phosphotransferase [archaeon]
LQEREEKTITLNVGLNPKEGKYHCTACNACYERYSIQDAIKLKWKCIKCTGRIKKGVKDRIKELSTAESSFKHSFRPEYVHMLPLAELIADAIKQKNVTSDKVQEVWKKFVEHFGTENKALIDSSVAELAEVHAPTAERVSAFRNGWVFYLPGGGGNYGKPVICLSEKEFKQKTSEHLKEINCESDALKQKTLGEF